MKPKKYRIVNNKRELGDYYKQEADNYGDYIGQRGTRKVIYRSDDGEVKVSNQAIFNTEQDFLPLSPKIRKIIKSYKPIKKAMLNEPDNYCNGKVYK